jgi:hypothetical protein
MPTEQGPDGKTVYTYVPADCLALLPFKSEPIVKWRHGNDLSKFKQRLHQGSFSAEYIDSLNEGERRQDLRYFHFLADSLTRGSVEPHHQRSKRRPAKIEWQIRLLSAAYQSQHFLSQARQVRLDLALPLRTPLLLAHRQ